LIHVQRNVTELPLLLVESITHGATIRSASHMMPHGTGSLQCAPEPPDAAAHQRSRHPAAASCPRSGMPGALLRTRCWAYGLQWPCAAARAPCVLLHSICRPQCRAAAAVSTSLLLAHTGVHLANPPPLSQPLHHHMLCQGGDAARLHSLGLEIVAIPCTPAHLRTTGTCGAWAPVWALLCLGTWLGPTPACRSSCSAQALMTQPIWYPVDASVAGFQLACMR
jgi:hypothetical protein